MNEPTDGLRDHIMLDLTTCTLAPGEAAEIQLPDGSIWLAQAQGGTLWLSSDPLPHPQGQTVMQLTSLCDAMALQDRPALGRGGRLIMDEHGHLRLQWPWPATGDPAAAWESARLAHQQWSAALQRGHEPTSSPPSSPPLDSQLAEDVFEHLQALLALDPELAQLVHADASARELVIEPEHEQWALALVRGAGPGEARILVPIDTWPIDDADALRRVHAALALNAGTHLGPGHWLSVELDGTECALMLFSNAPVVGAQLDDLQAALGTALSVAQEVQGPWSHALGLGAGHTSVTPAPATPHHGPTESSGPALDPGFMAGFMGLRG